MMNIKRIFTIALVSAGCLMTAAAQEGETQEVFNHHWFVQAQGGVSADLGEVTTGKLISPHVQVAGGYQFTPVWGLRLAVSGWESRAGSNLRNSMGDKVNYNWKWNYVAPMLDVSCDLTNWIGGYKPSRLCSVGLLAGVGANIAWNNGEAADVNQQIAQSIMVPVGADVAFLENLWCGTKGRFVGRFGAYLDFHVSRRVDLGIEVTANTLSDTYNSKKANNTDWYFNGLAGIRVRLGKVSKKKAVPVVAPVVVERVVERVVKETDTVYVEKTVDRSVEVREPLVRDIYFLIRSSEVAQSEMDKINDIVEYMNKYGDSKLLITGYADKGTGNSAINKKYSEDRANIVRDLLVNKFGISADRITVIAKGDAEQPKSINELNRVSICIAE